MMDSAPEAGEEMFEVRDLAMTHRITVDAMERLLLPENVVPMLDHGFIRVMDYMGGDEAVVQAARVSYGIGTKTPSDDEALIRYLLRHWHTTPFEMCEVKFHVKLPIFVARQWIRHRTANVNEYSARYSIVKDEFFMPEHDRLKRQSTTNRQGSSSEGYSDEIAEQLLRGLSDTSKAAFDIYALLVSDEVDLTRELARIGLPLSTYTEWYWKIDVHNLMHFLRLRADPHAQEEIRVYAKVMCEVLEAWMPMTMRAFVDYRLNAVTFSGPEMRILLEMLEPEFGGFVNPDHMDGLSKRELAEFKRKIGLAA